MRPHMKIPQNRAFRVLHEMYVIYVRGQVSRSSAALAYFLIISVFPTLMCAASVLGSLNITEDSVASVWENIIPTAAMNVIGDFLNYVNGNTSAVMLAVGIGAMLTSSSAAFRTIINIMGDIQGSRRYTGIFAYVFGFVLSVAFLAVIYLSGVVVVTGEWFLGWLEKNIGFNGIAGAWIWVRFVLLFGAMFVVIFGIYAIAAPKATRRIHKLPGALIASAAMVAVSAVYSRMISASVRYAIVYGSLASIIIMMIWLYTCGIIVIMGNVFNISLSRVNGHGY